MELIETCVLEHLNVNSENIKKALRSESRTRPLPYYRHLVLFFCYKYMKAYSLKEIGSFYNRDHATVTHAKDKILELCYAYKDTRLDVLEIDKIIQSYEKPVLSQAEEEEKFKEEIKAGSTQRILSFTERVPTGYKIRKQRYKRGKTLKPKEAKFKRGSKKKFDGRLL